MILKLIRFEWTSKAALSWTTSKRHPRSIWALPVSVSTFRNGSIFETCTQNVSYLQSWHQKIDNPRLELAEVGLLVPDTFHISKKGPQKNNTQTFPLLRVPGLWWACWQSEEAALEWTPAGGLHICVRKKRVKINLDQVWLGLARFGLVTSWGQCDWC